MTSIVTAVALILYAVLAGLYTLFAPLKKHVGDTWGCEQNTAATQAQLQSDILPDYSILRFETVIAVLIECSCLIVVSCCLYVCNVME